MKSFFYILLILLTSCKPTQVNTTDILTEKQKEEPQIAFFFLEASRLSETTFQVSLIKQKVVKGTLKGRFKKVIPTAKLVDKNWLVSLSDVHKNSIWQVQIHNPLIQEFEFVNNDGSLETKTIYHDKKEFVIRISYTNSIKTITFEQITKENNKLKTNLIDQIQL